MGTERRLVLTRLCAFVLLSTSVSCLSTSREAAVLNYIFQRNPSLLLQQATRDIPRASYRPTKINSYIGVTSDPKPFNSLYQSIQRLKRHPKAQSSSLSISPNVGEILLNNMGLLSNDGLNKEFNKFSSLPTQGNTHSGTLLDDPLQLLRTLTTNESDSLTVAQLLQIIGNYPTTPLPAENPKDLSADILTDENIIRDLIRSPLITAALTKLTDDSKSSLKPHTISKNQNTTPSSANDLLSLLLTNSINEGETINSNLDISEKELETMVNRILTRSVSNTNIPPKTGVPLPQVNTNTLASLLENSPPSTQTSETGISSKSKYGSTQFGIPLPTLALFNSVATPNSPLRRDKQLINSASATLDSQNAQSFDQGFGIRLPFNEETNSISNPNSQNNGGKIQEFGITTVRNFNNQGRGIPLPALPTNNKVTSHTNQNVLKSVNSFGIPLPPINSNDVNIPGKQTTSQQNNQFGIPLPALNSITSITDENGKEGYGIAVPESYAVSKNQPKAIISQTGGPLNGDENIASSSLGIPLPALEENISNVEVKSTRPNIVIETQGQQTNAQSTPLGVPLPSLNQVSTSTGITIGDIFDSMTDDILNEVSGGKSINENPTTIPSAVIPLVGDTDLNLGKQISSTNSETGIPLPALGTGASSTSSGSLAVEIDAKPAAVSVSAPKPTTRKPSRRRKPGGRRGRKRPEDLLRSTLSDLWFSKGQWIGTLIGGFVDIGRAVIDAFSQNRNKSPRNSRSDRDIFDIKKK